VINGWDHLSDRTVWTARSDAGHRVQDGRLRL